MANTVNSKVYTDHSLMDEVVYHCKTILNNIVLKNEVTANENETEESITESDYYIACVNGTMELSFFPLTEQWLMDYGYPLSKAKIYAKDWTQIPEEDREDLLNYLVNRYINEYDEKNNYYRMLIGLPEYGTTEYDIYISPSDPRLEDDDNNTDFNFNIPIHQYTIKQINTLKSLGIIDDLMLEHEGDPHYKYLDFLGGTKVKLYDARIAANWDILFMPTCENLVKNRFKEIYMVNRNIYMRRTYQDAYSFMSDYYDEMVMVMVLCQTFADMIAELPEWYIRRDIFDLRSAKYFLESQGVKFFKEIPLKYQIKLVKNLNRLIKYKSTNKNIHDILEVFGVAGTTVYKYYIYKDYVTSGAYDGIDEYGNKFKLAFVQVPIDESYDRYIQDNMYLKDYDTVTEMDKYWDGDLDHALVKARHGEKDFSIEGTKYMFLDYSIDMLKYRFEMCYFIGMIFNSKVSTEEINLMIPSISETNYYSITDLCILLCCLAGPYTGRNPKIHIPMLPDESEWVMADRYDFGDEEIDIINFDPALGGEVYDFGVNYAVDPAKPYHRYDFLEEIEGEELSNPVIDTDDDESSVNSNTVNRNVFDDDRGDWIRNRYDYLWKYTKWMIYGFNLKANLQKLEEDISIRHSAFGFEHGYTLSDFGCDTFMTANRISSVEQLNEIYMSNKACFDNLIEFMETKCDTRDKAVVAQYVFDNLFLNTFDLEFYRLKSGGIAEYYTDLLKERSYSLYKFYLELTKEPDPEIQKDGIRIVLNDIVTTLEYFIGNQQNLEFAFSFVPTSSPEAIIQYMSLVINFFKSWKVYFLDPTSSYLIIDANDNQTKFYETINELKYDYWKDDHNTMRDSYKTNVQLFFTDDRYTFTKEIVEMYGYFSQDIEFDNVYDGWYPDTETGEEIKADGGAPDDCVPFRMVNGGTPYGINLFDTITLDGGPVYEQLEYKDINGFLVSDPAGKMYGNDLELIGYPVFGGFPGKLWSTSVNTNISEILEISNDIIISSQYIDNALVVEPDGLYYGNGIGNYVSRTQYNEFVVLLDYADGTLLPLGYYYNEWLKIFSSEPYMQNAVDKAYEHILNPMYNIMEPTRVFKNIIEFTNYKLDQFNKWFDDINPFDWEKIDE